jgi:hypothetical protein
MLEDMLYESEDPDFSVCLAESPLSGGDGDALRAEYRARYARAVAAVSTLRGEPIFEGDPRLEPGVSWIEGAEASVWHDPGGELYVARIEGHANVQVVAGGRPLRREPNAVTVLPPGD